MQGFPALVVSWQRWLIFPPYVPPVYASLRGTNCPEGGEAGWSVYYEGAGYDEGDAVEEWVHGAFLRLGRCTALGKVQRTVGVVRLWGYCSTFVL